MTADETLDAIAGRLTRIGFAVQADEDRGAFFGRTVRLRRHDLEVDLDRDRFGFVTLGIVVPGTGLIGDVDLWIACLDGRTPLLTDTTVHEAVEALEARLDDIERAATQEAEDLRECLDQLGEERLMNRAALGPSPDVASAERLVREEFEGYVGTQVDELERLGFDVAQIRQEPDVFRRIELIRALRSRLTN